MPEPPGLAPPRDTQKLAALVLALAATVTLLLLAFGLPAVHAAPHRLPVGLAGPAQAVDQVRAHLPQDNTFRLSTYPDEAALRAAIDRRDVYGGLVVAPDRQTMLVASAASATVAQVLTQMAAAIGEQTGRPVAVVDAKPLPAADPRGAGLNAAALPLTMGGILPAAVLLTVFPRRRWLRVAGAAAFAAVTGLAAAGVLIAVFGTVPDDFWPVSSALALGMAAIALTVLGLESVLGGVGLGLGVAVMILLGTPLSGLMSAPEMLPPGWGTLGQALPPGAAATLLRSCAYFDGRGAGWSVSTLLGWVALGAALSLAGHARTRRAKLPANP